MKYERNIPDKKGYYWTDYCCEGCSQYKMVKKRETDGKMLCKKCQKNQSLMMFKTTQNKAQPKHIKRI